MPISVFENSLDETLTFILEPNEERYEVPPHARIGVRYASQQDDRVFAYFGERTIRFWCDSEAREVEIVHPNAFDLLLWDICVGSGFCSGLVNDQPMHVTDLLPATGIITADEFARLAIRAEGDGAEQSEKVERWTAYLRTKFVEHMGGSSAAAEALVQNIAQPFDSGPC